MFYDNELRFLQKMLEKCHIHSTIFDPDTSVQSRLSPPFHQVFRFGRFGDSFYDLVPNLHGATVYRLSDVYLCRYIFLELPYCETPSVLLIGPYLNNNVTHQQIMEQAEQMGQPPSGIRQLELFYSALPVVREEHHLFAMVNTFCEYVYGGENFSSADLHFDHATVALPDFVPNKTSDAGGLDVALMEHRYQFENELMDAVAQGNSHKAELLMAGFSSLAFESRTSDQLRNLKNYCIIMNTLMRKAAEKGRVHPVHLDRISSDYARRIEALRTLNEAPNFMLEMMRAYCRLVKRHSMKNFSPLVQKAMICIESDLTGDLSLNAVAEKNSISPGYLSGLFKKETGQTFTAYVNGRRVAMAKHLLKTTHLQIQTIAQHCGILDFHYFCRRFKSVTGKTPTEYRNSHIVDAAQI